VRASEAEETSWDVTDELPSTTTLDWPRLVRRVVLALLGVVLLVLVVQSAIAYSALQDARGAQKFLVGDIARGDLPAAQDHARLLAADTGRARLGVWGPWWALPEAVPWYGDDVRAVRLTVRALDDVASKVALPLIESSAQIESGLRKPDGSVDVAVLDRLTTELAAASQQADDASARMATINAAGLASPLRGTVVQTRGDLQRLAKTVHGIRDGLVLAQTLVGAQQPRVTLLGVQNPAESRGTGGIIGAWALLRGAKGKVTLGSTGVNNQLIPFPPPRSDVPRDVLDTYGEDVLDVRNANTSPDFPVGARLLADGYRRYALADGAPPLPADAMVLTVTPAALGRMLTLTGPVTVKGYGAPITGDNAASMFTNGVYSEFPREAERVTFIHDVLTEVFTRLQRQDSDPMQLVDQLRGMVSDRELMAWSPDAQIEAAITGLGMSGALPRPAGDRALVTLVNSDASKLDYYLRASIALRPTARGSSTLAISLTNIAPATVASYVGNHDPRTDLAETTHDVVLQLHLPPSVGIARVLLDGRPTGVSLGTESGWTVVRRLVRLPRGETATLSVVLNGDARALTTVVPPVMTSPAEVTVRR
jgi:hypothetical protein